MEKIGIDIGRVIIEGDTDNSPEGFFSNNFINVPEVSGAFLSIKQIVGRFGDENVYLISKCGPQTELKTLEWLKHHRIYQFTGIRAENIHFCRNREDKRVICLKFDIQTFVDDRFSVLKHLLDLKRLILFNPMKEELDEYLSKSGTNIHIVDNWDELINLI